MKLFPFNLQKNLDKKLVQSLRQTKIPSFRQFRYLFKVLKPKERSIFLAALGLIVISASGLGLLFYLSNFLPQPASGGEYTEGLIGAPQYINPLLSQTNDVDSDISRLVFSGLLKYDKNLEPIADLAQDWQVNDQQTQYTFTLKPNLQWPDGEPLTADDVIFTVRSIQDPDFKSPLLVSFRGVSVKKIDERTINFELSEPYPSFLEVLTFGILPEHVWGQIPAINANLTEYNLKPIGSGVWQFKSLLKDRLGNLKAYTLVPNPNYYGPKPYLEKITFKFYPDFNTAVAALKNHSVEGISFLPKELKKEISNQKNLRLYSFALPQYTAIFFNQKQNEILTDKDIRQALALAIDKPKILTEALQLEGAIIDGPLTADLVDSGKKAISFDLPQANNLLDQAGWKQITAQQYQEFLADQARQVAAAQADAADNQNQSDNNQETSTPTGTPTTIPDTKNQELVEPSQQIIYRRKDDQILEITLTTVNQPENTKAAQLVQEFWQAIGVKVNLQIVEPGKISREIIKPRQYQALLFGVIVGANPDPYPFWHSSQIQDPGLNLALFANRNVDKLLETARTTGDEAERKKSYQEFQDILSAELPAIFLYNPTYAYVVDQKIKGLDIDRIITPADRFNNLNEWYIKTKRQYQPQD